MNKHLLSGTSQERCLRWHVMYAERATIALREGYKSLARTYASLARIEWEDYLLERGIQA